MLEDFEKLKAHFEDDFGVITFNILEDFEKLKTHFGNDFGVITFNILEEHFGNGFGVPRVLSFGVVVSWLWDELGVPQSRLGFWE